MLEPVWLDSWAGNDWELMQRMSVLASEPVYSYRHLGAFRLLLAALVMWQHFAADLAPEPFAGRTLPFEVGGVAVLVFFALSGFVIVEATDRVYRDKPFAFAGNRMLRIVPHFVLAVALSILLHKLYLVAGGSRLWRSQPDFPHALAFAPINIMLNFVGIIPFMDRLIGYNFLDITWAVRVEIAFYASMFLVLALSGLAQIKGRLTTPLAISLVPFLGLFVLAMHRRGLGVFQFVPYFTFGGAVYFAITGRRLATLIAAAAIPLMAWQYLARAFALQIIANSSYAPWVNLTLLFALLVIMVFLSAMPLMRGRRTDRLLGNLTYPLYLYHEDVLVLLLTFTIGYSWGVFVAGLVLSVVAAGALYALIDPRVDHYRDRLRGHMIDPQSTSRQNLTSAAESARWPPGSFTRSDPQRPRAG